MNDGQAPGAIGQRRRETHTTTGERKTGRRAPVSNYVLNPSYEETTGEPDYPVGPTLGHNVKEAGPPIGRIAHDRSLGGLSPGTTSRSGGTIPYHTSGLWNTRTPLQDQPKAKFYRET